MAENFLNIPDEISCDFYEIDKQKINFEDDEMDIFYRPNDVKLTPDGRNKSNLCYDSSDPFGLFSCSFCNNYHVTYKVLTKTEDFNDFVVELMKLLFIYCSYFPPDDLVDLQLLRKDLSSHNLFMIFSLCSYVNIFFFFFYIFFFFFFFFFFIVDNNNIKITYDFDYDKLGSFINTL